MSFGVLSRACVDFARRSSTCIFKHLGIVPWAFVSARSREGAIECVRQVKAQPLENHDPVTRDFLSRVGHDLEARADGGDLTRELDNAIGELDMAMLNEAPGEGYHRGTNVEKQRAASSTTVHMTQSVRIKGVIATCRKFMRAHGAKGRAVFRYEWVSWKRLLQTSRKRRWIGKKLSRKAFRDRMYRRDAKALENWSSILTRVANARPVEHEQVSNLTQLQNEYFKSVLVPGTYYHIGHPVTEQDASGFVSAVVRRDFF